MTDTLTQMAVQEALIGNECTRVALFILIPSAECEPCKILGRASKGCALGQCLFRSCPI